jgi:hypothetical protein
VGGSIVRIVLVVVGLLAVGGAGAGSAAAACPNEAVRIGASAQLPDCRAYEQVSPVEKNGADVSLLNEAVAVGGGAISYPSNGGFAGAAGNATVNQYLGRRGPDGWTTEALMPPFLNPGGLSAPQYSGFAPDLSYQAVDVALVAPTPEYLYRHNPDGSFTLLNPGMPPSTAIGAAELFAGASDDFSRIFLQTPEVLTSDAPEEGNKKLYRWEGGELTLVSALPDGTGTSGTDRGIRPVSADGSRVYWRADAGSASGALYLSEGGVSRLVSKGQAGALASATFMAASRDGSIAYLTSEDKLTEGASPAGADLYRYDAGGDALVDLTPDPLGASVEGVVGTSEDGGTVYFVALGVLAAGATAGEPNLYVNDGSQTRFIATLANTATEAVSWNPQTVWQQSTSAQVSPDGRTAVFTSTAPLQPGYENDGHTEIYRYELGGTLSCVSCDPGGAPAGGDASLTQAIAPGAANIQTQFPVNNIGAGGAEVFFETPDALLPGDTNGLRDVYEWEAQGSRDCRTAGGCLYLISTGHSGDASTFEGAGRSGEDVFFLTRERLVGQDRDDYLDVYDARTGGGLAAQNPPPLPPACSGDDCRAPAPPPGAAPLIGSAGFVGPPNPAPKRKAHKRRCKRGGHGRRAGKQAKRVGKHARRAGKCRRRRGARHRATVSWISRVDEGRK